MLEETLTISESGYWLTDKAMKMVDVVAMIDAQHEKRLAKKHDAVFDRQDALERTLSYSN